MEKQLRAGRSVFRNSIALTACGLAAATTLSGTQVYAQFPSALGGLVGGNKPPASDGQVVMAPADVEAHYGQLNARFFHSLREMLTAQSYTFAALGDKLDADRLSAEAASLEGTNTLNEVSKSIAISQDASKNIDGQMANAGLMDAQGKAQLVQAIPHYAKGMIDAVQLPHDYQVWLAGAQQTANGMKGNPMQAMRLPHLLGEIREVAGVTVNLPVLIGTWSTTTANFAKFSQKNKVDTSGLSAKI